MRDNKLQFIIQSAIFAAIIAVLAQIAIPMPSGVPITLQTFAIALCGFFLGPIKAIISVAIYILIGAIGLPVFANLHGGLGILLGATGGFIFGFLPMAFLCGISSIFKIKNYKNIKYILMTVVALIIALIGLIICHILGAWQFSKISTKVNSFMDALPLVSYPFIIKDVLSVFFAYFLSDSIKLRLDIR